MMWFAYLLTLAAGAANPVQAGSNAELRKQLGSVLWSGAIVYIVGLLGVLLLQAFARESFPLATRFAAVKWWAWTGGLVSIASTLAGLALAQKLGSGVFTGLNITAALTVSLLLDNFGWVGFKIHPASPARIAGCALMITGLWIVARF